jgi:hypothetical protein
MAALPQFVHATASKAASKVRTVPCFPQISLNDLICCIVLTDCDVSINVKRGVIILQYVDAIDLEFPWLDPLDHPAKRLPIKPLKTTSANDLFS